MRRAESDTSPEVDALFRRRLMERPGADRLRMACDMFDAATELIVASLPAGITASTPAGRILLLQRRYWSERHDPVIQAAMAALERTT